jgi:hypothetical protein
VTVIAVDDEAAFAQQRATLALDLDPETGQCFRVGQHVGLAGERRGASGSAQVVPEREFRSG